MCLFTISKLRNLNGYIEKCCECAAVFQYSKKIFCFEVEEWRGKWFLEKKWESSSDEQLLDGMCDINDHVRLSAVSACSKAFLQKKITETNAKAKRKRHDCSNVM